MGAQISNGEFLRRCIERNYGAVRRVRQAGRWASAEDRELCSDLQSFIYGTDVSFDGWTLSQVMTYVFLANQSLHRSRHGLRWKNLKRAAQDWIAANHHDCVTLVRSGKFAGFYQAKCGEWVTHWLDERKSALRKFVLNSDPRERPPEIALRQSAH